MELPILFSEYQFDYKLLFSLPWEGLFIVPLIWLLRSLFLRCKNQAFPIGIEEQIRKGKTWLYVPVEWEMRKTWVRLKLNLHFFAILLCVSLFLVKMVSASIESTPLIFVGQFIFFALITFFVLRIFVKKWLVIRSEHQEVSYNGLCSSIKAQLYRNGKNVSDAEVKNLCNWQHQNLLRSADKRGVLLQEMEARFKARQIIFKNL